MALTVSVFDIAEYFENLKWMPTQGLSNTTKKSGLGLKTASVEVIKCKIRVLDKRPF